MLQKSAVQLVTMPTRIFPLVSSFLPHAGTHASTTAKPATTAARRIHDFESILHPFLRERRGIRKGCLQITRCARNGKREGHANFLPVWKPLSNMNRLTDSERGTARCPSISP